MYKDPSNRRAYAKKHRSDNIAQYRANESSNKKVIRERNKKVVYGYLITHPCVDCGYSDVRALEFDHVRGEKYKDVSKLVNNCSSVNTIVREILKCEVRCANCHRIVTYDRRAQ